MRLIIAKCVNGSTLTKQQLHNDLLSLRSVQPNCASKKRHTQTNILLLPVHRLYVTCEESASSLQYIFFSNLVLIICIILLPASWNCKLMEILRVIYIIICGHLWLVYVIYLITSMLLVNKQGIIKPPREQLLRESCTYIACLVSTATTSVRSCGG